MPMASTAQKIAPLRHWLAGLRTDGGDGRFGGTVLTNARAAVRAACLRAIASRARRTRAPTPRSTPRVADSTLVSSARVLPRTARSPATAMRRTRAACRFLLVRSGATRVGSRRGGAAVGLAGRGGDRSAIGSTRSLAVTRRLSLAGGTSVAGGRSVRGSTRGAVRVGGIVVVLRARLRSQKATGRRAARPAISCVGASRRACSTRCGNASSGVALASSARRAVLAIAGGAVSTGGSEVGAGADGFGVGWLGVVGWNDGPETSGCATAGAGGDGGGGSGARITRSGAGCIGAGGGS